MSEKMHWEKVYATKSAQTVSWYQAQASLSLDLIQSAVAAPDARILDVGGGASTLVDGLISAGYRQLTVLDLSGAALDVAQRRLGAESEVVSWVEGDVTQVELAQHSIDLWHDRAVFHFLTNEADRQSYVAQVMHAVKPGGHVIVATFAPDGPLQCSGLPVRRYAVEELHAEFGQAFELVEHTDEYHVTPSGQVQHFIYCHCRTSGGVGGSRMVNSASANAS